MANVKITELTAATALAGTDVLPIVDVGADATKKVSVSDLLRNLPDGSAASPSLAFADDQNTGVLSPGDNSLAFATSGTQRLVIDSSGNVGIGQSSPVVALQVSGASAARIQLSTDNTGHTATDGVRIQVDSSNNLELLQRESANIEFFTAGTERLRIDSSGKVGIGTTSPSAPLTVFGGSASSPTIRIEGGSSGNDNARIESEYNLVLACNGDGDQSDRTIQFRNNATNLVTIDSSGRVGIGTTSPTSVLDIRDTQTGAASEIKLFNLDQGNTTTQTSALVMTPDIRANGAKISVAKENADFSSSANKDVAITFAPVSNNTATERLRIDSSGKLLIGSSTGSIHGNRLLQIGKTDRAETYVSIVSSTSGQSGLLFADTTTNDNGGYRGQIRYHHSDDSMNFRTAATERMRITSAGNVGIGTTSPSSLLHLESASSPKLLLVDTTNSCTLKAYAQNSNAHLGTESNHDFIFDTNNTERMRIDSSGNVIVGTSSTVNPTLRILGSSAHNSFIQFADGDSNNVGQLQYSHSSNALITAVNGSERMRIDALGNVAIGTTTIGSAPLTLYSSASRTMYQGSSTGTGNGNGFTTGNNGGANAFVWNYENGFMQFATNNTERMRIDSGGASRFFSSSATVRCLSGASAGTSVDIFIGSHSASSTTSEGTISFKIKSNGNVQNTNNSYGAISDAKLKENIVDASSQWDDIKDIRIRNYNFIQGQTHTQIGVVAQEVETVSPGLVSESPDLDDDGNDLGTVTKSVNYSVLYMKAVKALQEAMDRIETLEAKVAALEAQ